MPLRFNNYSEGGILKTRLSFPQEYPVLPPRMTFITPMSHPNIYADGTLCVSILHAPGEDQYGYEDAGEKWPPVHIVESIRHLLAQLGASESRQPCYKKKVRRLARKSAEAWD